MRLAYHDVAWIKDPETEKLIGVCLGYDYCAEHEWGTKELNQLLGIWAGDPTTEKKVWGFNRHRVTNPSLVKFFETEVSLVPEGKKRKAKTTVYACGLLSQYSFEKDAENIERAKERITTNTWHFDENHPLRAMWDGATFLFWSLDKEKVEEVYKHFQEKRILKGMKPATPFGGSGLMFLFEEAYSKEYEKTVIEEQKDYLDMWNRVHKNGILSRLEKAKKGYYACNPKKIQFESHVSDTEERKIKDVQKKSKLPDIIFWLNPADQQNTNYGWFTVEELDQWCKDTGPIPMKKEK